MYLYRGVAWRLKCLLGPSQQQLKLGHWAINPGVSYQRLSLKVFPVHTNWVLIALEVWSSSLYIGIACHPSETGRKLGSAWPDFDYKK